MREFPETNYSLIGRVQALGDGASWEEFLAIYQPVVLRMARNRGLQDADAQDVMQQIFLSISRAIQGWQEDPNQPPFRAWLSTVARNAITKHLSRRPRDAASGSSSVFEMLHQLPDADSTSKEFENETRLEIFRCAADQIRNEFTPETWNVFWKTAVEGQPITNVTRSTGKSAGSIYVARFRVMSRLKEKINEIVERNSFRFMDP